MRSFSVALDIIVAALCANLVTASSCTAQDGEVCVAAASPTEPKVAAALAAEQPSSSVHLLQREVAKAGQGEESTAALATGLHVSNTARAALATNDSMSLSVNGNFSANVSLGRENSSTCSSFTGMMCMLTDCEATLSAQCDDVTKFCKCPSYTCFNNGKCELSPTEIADALKKGVSGVGETVTSIASKVPGIADSVGGLLGAASGIADTIGGMLGDLVGGNQDKCDGRYISTCFFSDCDESLGFTASCVYGSCQCKEGFCAVNGKCMVDLGSLLAGGR